MHTPSSLKQEFLKKWIMGLQVCNSRKKEMSLMERKKAIKLSADVAMASVRNASTCWSQALIANASRDDNNKVLIECMTAGSESINKLNKACFGSVISKKIVTRSNKILRKSCSLRRVKKNASKVVQASLIAKRMVKKRTQLLKSLIPGGESMEESFLIKETLDYILSLRAQVDVMRRLANANELLSIKQGH